MNFKKFIESCIPLLFFTSMSLPLLLLNHSYDVFLTFILGLIIVIIIQLIFYFDYGFKAIYLAKRGYKKRAIFYMNKFNEKKVMEILENDDFTLIICKNCKSDFNENEIYHNEKDDYLCPFCLTEIEVID